MFYITKCYVGHAGTTLRPGEAFEADSRDEKIKRLLHLGAIVPATPAFAPVGGDGDNDDQQDGDQADQENDRQQMENLGDDASGDPLDDEESDEEPIDIDGLDGIVEASAEETAPAAAPAPPGKTRSKRA